MAEFRPGESVYWWKRHSKNGEYPFRSRVVALGAKRVTIEVEDPEGDPEPIVRHVATESLQRIEVFWQKATDQGPSILEPMATWGKFTRYLEVGEDLYSLRHVDVYENGKMLSYDRTHWVDDFGLLAGARINRNRHPPQWGRIEEIGIDEFDRVWEASRTGPTWAEQVATAQMEKQADIPMWFTIKGWRPLLRPKKA